MTNQETLLVLMGNRPLQTIGNAMKIVKIGKNLAIANCSNLPLYGS